jgi:hypothetical protein
VIVHPADVPSAYLDHGAKQAMALANLRRHNSTLQYLKNQNIERVKVLSCEEGKLSSSDRESEDVSAHFRGVGLFLHVAIRSTILLVLSDSWFD